MKTKKTKNSKKVYNKNHSKNLDDIITDNSISDEESNSRFDDELKDRNPQRDRNSNSDDVIGWDPYW